MKNEGKEFDRVLLKYLQISRMNLFEVTSLYKKHTGLAIDVDLMIHYLKKSDIDFIIEEDNKYYYVNI